MDNQDTLQSLENQAYRRAYSDGIIDLFVGASLLWIGAAWIWLTDFAGLAGILPAVFVPVVMVARARFVESRLGYVRWAEPRQNKERRNLILLFAFGLFLFLAGILAFLVVDQSLVGPEIFDIIGPGLLAWLLALLSLALALMMESWRYVVYAMVLGIAGAITAVQDANPGWPMLVAGAVVAVTGLGMFVAFVQDNPAPTE